MKKKKYAKSLRVGRPHVLNCNGVPMQVGVVGFGGLGHMCTKLSLAMGNEVNAKSSR